VRVQIRTLQGPRFGAGAFAPTLTYGGAPCSNGQNKISGAPGTVPVYSPRPPSINDGILGGPYNQPSNVAPDWILPALYTFHENATVRFPGKLQSDNVMPVPIPNYGRSALQWQHRFRVGGRTATSAVRPFTNWPTYSGNRS
jgi:hypothetical protein